MFFFEHEAWHYKYSKNKKIYSEHAEVVKTACKYVCESLKYDKLFREDKEKESYIHFYDVISNNEKYLEELCCDIFAIFNIIPIYAKLYNLSMGEAYGECFRLTRHIINFQNILNQIEDYWDNSYTHIKKTYLCPDQEYIKKSSDYIDDMIGLKRKRQKEQYDLRLLFTQIIAPVVYEILGINVTGTMDDVTDFFSSDVYKNCFVPMLDKTILNYDFANNFYKLLINIFDKYSLLEFRKMRNQLIGWK